MQRRRRNVKCSEQTPPNSQNVILSNRQLNAGVNPRRWHQYKERKKANPVRLFSCTLQSFLVAPCFGPDPCSKLSCSFHGWPWFGAVGSLCLLNPGCAELPAGSERSPAGTLLSHPPAGTRLHFQPSLALLCVSALQPRQQSDREAEGRPESGQRKREREASD